MNTNLRCQTSHLFDECNIVGFTKSSQNWSAYMKWRWLKRMVRRNSRTIDKTSVKRPVTKNCVRSPSAWVFYRRNKRSRCGGGPPSFHDDQSRRLPLCTPYTIRPIRRSAGHTPVLSLARQFHHLYRFSCKREQTKRFLPRPLCFVPFSFLSRPTDESQLIVFYRSPLRF